MTVLQNRMWKAYMLQKGDDGTTRKGFTGCVDHLKLGSWALRGPPHALPPFRLIERRENTSLSISSSGQLPAVSYRALYCNHITFYCSYSLNICLPWYNSQEQTALTFWFLVEYLIWSKEMINLEANLLKMTAYYELHFVPRIHMLKS